MKKPVFAVLLGVWALAFNSCAVMGGIRAWTASSKINNSAVAAQNKAFQTNSGVNLTYVARALWSMQSSSKNKHINGYFERLLENSLVYTFDEGQAEFAKQTRNDDEVHIAISGMCGEYSDLEKAVMVAASTSVIAAMSDPKMDSQKAKAMFFRFLDEYSDIPGITNSAWYQKRSLAVTGDGVLFM